MTSGAVGAAAVVLGLAGMVGYGIAYAVAHLTNPTLTPNRRRRKRYR